MPGRRDGDVRRTEASGSGIAQRLYRLLAEGRPELRTQNLNEMGVAHRNVATAWQG